MTVRSSDPNARHGIKYIYGQNAASFHVWQVVDLGASGVDLINLDLENDTVHVGGWQAGWHNAPDFGHIEVEFLDASQASIETHATSPITTNHNWVHQSLNLSVPSGTRYITYHFYGTRNDGSNADAYLDDAFLNYSSILEITAADIVSVDGKEWAQADLFHNLSWDNINTVCPAGVCGAGTLNGYDMDGWTWASVDEVSDLFNFYLIAGGVSGGNLLGPAPDSYQESLSTWAPAFFSDGWRVTYIDSVNELVSGYSSSDGALIAIEAAAPLISLHGPASSIDQARNDIDSLKSDPNPLGGAWFYRLADSDGDGVPDETDNCPAVANANQTNTDGLNDGGDECDTDDDEDGWADVDDNCPLIANPNPKDGDGDGVGNACDNCRIVSNPGQEDSDGNGCGDPCEGTGCGGPFCMNPEP